MVMEYVFLAVGVVTTFIVLGVCARLGISINEHVWVLAIPAVVSLILNVSLLGIYRKYKRNRPG